MFWKFEIVELYTSGAKDQKVNHCDACSCGVYRYQCGDGFLRDGRFVKNVILMEVLVPTYDRLIRRAWRDHGSTYALAIDLALSLRYKGCPGTNNAIISQLCHARRQQPFEKRSA